MVEQEYTEQLREVTGVVHATCDLCGRVVDRTAITPIHVSGPAEQPTEIYFACPECFAAAERGEIDLDGDDEEPIPTTHLG